MDWRRDWVIVIYKRTVSELSEKLGVKVKALFASLQSGYLIILIQIVGSMLRAIFLLARVYKFAPPKVRL